MTAPAVQVLGKADCPVCHVPDQEVRASKKGKAYIMCDECECQIFSRSRRSHDALIALIATPTPKPTPKPAADERPQPAKPAPEPRGRGALDF